MMKFSPQKLATYLLLAVYGGIAVLGYGLHELSPAHLHHHASTVGLCTAHGHSHAGCGHNHHGHNHEPESTPASANLVLTDAHDCEICVFLDQIRSFQPQIGADVFSQPFAGEVSIASWRIASLAIAGLHAPRGPPSLLGSLG